MNDVAIRAENIAKQYKIGAARFRHDTLRDQLTHGLKSLFRRESAAESDTAWALNGVSVEIPKGEIVGIIGRNGAGKSTLLKVLCRITAPTSGRAEIYGRMGSLLEVGTGFHYELTGRENIYLSAAILGMTKAEINRKFDEIVEFSEVEKFIDTPVKHYSSGMYVRLGFAVAAHLDPDILVIDEVLSVGDLAFQRKCAERMARLQERHSTVIIVSHNMFAIKTMCKRVLYLDRGRVQAYGAPTDVIPAYEADILHEKDVAFETPRWAQAAIPTAPSERPICITEMDILDESGQPRTMFDCGERMRVRLKYDARQPIASPNFVVALIRSDNVNCCDYSSALDGCRVPLISETGELEVLTPPIKLVSDLYTVHVIVWDANFQRLYAAQVCKSFHVRHPLLSTAFGVFHEAAEWDVRS